MKSVATIIAAVCVFAVHAGAANLEAGKATYQAMCTACHGDTGAGDGAAAAALTPKPGDLAAAVAKGDEYLKTVITKGGPAVGLSPMMAALGANLTPEQLADLIAYIKSL